MKWLWEDYQSAEELIWGVGFEYLDWDECLELKVRSRE